MAYGDDYAGYYISLRNETAGKIRNPRTGRYIKRSAKELLDANKRHALALQADVVENVKGSILRRQVTTGRLATVTADRQNVFWTESGFGVGDEEFLDNSVAKYWRQIEEGTDVHVGREIRGVFGGSMLGVRRAGSPFTAFGEAYGGKFVPIKGRKFIYDGGRRIRVRKSEIQNPIEAHEDYAGAFYSNGGMAERTIDAAIDYLRGVVNDAMRFDT